ncbi:hypothetical protein D3C84_677620 [compost metagenome]
MVLEFFLAGEVLHQLAVVVDDARPRAQRRVVQRLGIALQTRAIDLLQGLQGEVFLAGEVVVEGALGYTGGLHDFLHAGAVITATGHHLGAFGEDQVTFVESLVGVHAGKDMTGRLASPSTIDLCDKRLQRRKQGQPVARM